MRNEFIADTQIHTNKHRHTRTDTETHIYIHTHEGRATIIVNSFVF